MRTMKRSSTTPDHIQEEHGSTAGEEVGVHLEIHHEVVRERAADLVAAIRNPMSDA
jgi:hypothetical protein